MKIIFISLFLVLSVLSQSNLKKSYDPQSCIDSLGDLQEVIDKFVVYIVVGEFDRALDLLPEIKEKLEKVKDECDYPFIQ